MRLTMPLPRPKVKLGLGRLRGPRPGYKFEVVLLTAAVIGLNLLVLNFGFVKVDLTADRRYSLSPATKEILAQLPDRVEVKVYISSKIPGKFVPLKNYVISSLLTMKRLSGGKLSLQIYDPDQDQKYAREAKQLGLPEVEFTLIENDQFQTKKGFFGLVLTFTDRKAVIPVFDKIDTFEYDFMSRLLKITADYQPKLYLTSGQGEDWQEYQNLRQGLSRNYDLVDYLPETQKISDLDKQKAKAILVFNPTTQWKPESIDNLKKWQEANGNLVIFTDNLGLDKNFVPDFRTERLNPLLQAFGVKMENKLVLAPRGEVISFRNPNIPFPIFQYYGFWFRLKPEFIDSSLAWKNDLIGVVLPWSGVLSLTEDQSNYQVIAKVKGVNLVDCPCDLSPQAYKYDPNLSDSGVIGVIYQPPGKGQVLIFSDADFVNDNALSRYPNNLKAALDAVDYLAFDDRLAQIRAKTIINRSIKDMNQSQKQLTKWLILSLPAVMTLMLALTILTYNRLKRSRLV